MCVCVCMYGTRVSEATTGSGRGRKCLGRGGRQTNGMGGVFGVAVGPATTLNNDNDDQVGHASTKRRCTRRG